MTDKTPLEIVVDGNWNHEVRTTPRHLILSLSKQSLGVPGDPVLGKCHSVPRIASRRDMLPTLSELGAQGFRDTMRACSAKPKLPPLQQVSLGPRRRQTLNRQ